MRLILVGAPGSGKGTQAKLLSGRLRLQHISTGDILRDSLQQDTPLARLAKPFMNHGKLVPDDLVNEIVADRFRRGDRPERFVMDGYPRTLAQAAAFDQVLRQQFLDLTAVIVFLVDDEEIVRRLSGRWICPKCHASYHVTSNPPKRAGVCDVDGAVLTQRDDDREVTVRHRLREYHRTTAGLIPHYRAQGLIREVPTLGDIETIYATIIQLLNQAGSPC